MIINNLQKNRNKLHEGRSMGMGFAFARKVNNNYETVQSISPCKDYLNDVLYYEKNGITLAEIYGFEYNPPKVKTIFGKKYAYLVIDFFSDKDSHDWFKKNYKLTQKRVNDLEESIKDIVGRTQIIKQNNMYLVKIPLYWVSRYYRLSLITLLLRAFSTINDDLPIIDLIKKRKSWYLDAGLIMSLKQIIERIDILNIDYGDINYNPETQFSGVIHNDAGVISYLKNK